MTREDIEAAFAAAYECPVEKLDPPIIDVALELVRRHNEELAKIFEDKWFNTTATTIRAAKP